MYCHSLLVIKNKVYFIKYMRNINEMFYCKYFNYCLVECEAMIVFESIRNYTILKYAQQIYTILLISFNIIPKK